jgi:glycerophosphoryl diester phosphodiesterase
MGADGVELDVHRTADGTPVVHHDPVLPGVGPIAELDRGALPPTVPTLAEALAACGPMTVNVEIKRPSGDGVPAVSGLAGAVLGAVTGAGATDRVVVSSFSVEVLDAVGFAARAAGTVVRRGWLIPVVTDPHALLGEVEAQAIDAVHPFVSWVDEPLVHEAGRRGLHLHVWTVNNDEDLRTMLRLGVAAVITDRPLAARALRQEG